MTMRPAAIAGEEVSASPTSYSQRFAPVCASSPYNLPSLDPTKMRPPETAGEESTRARVTIFHAALPVAASSAWMA